MSKYQHTKFNNEELPNAATNSSNFLDKNHILFEKGRKSSLKKLNSNLVDKLAMDSGLSKKSTLIGLNSITNPIHSELNEPLTEIELDNDDHTIHHLDLLSGNNATRMSAHEHLINGVHHNQSATNQHEQQANMKRMLVSLDTSQENGSNLNRSYQYSTNTLTEPNGQADAILNTPADHQPTGHTLGLMNAVHLNHCSNNNSFNASPNVSFFGLQTTTIDPSGNTIFGNFGKFKNNARFSTFFRKMRFIWHRATLLERLFSLFIFMLLLTICYLSFTVLSLQQLNKNLEQANKRMYTCLRINYDAIR